MTAPHLIPIITAAVASFIFGALWYSPLLFMKHWCRETGVDPSKNINNPVRVYSLTFSITLFTAFAFSHVMGPTPPLNLALPLALLVSIAFVGTSMGINYQFAQRSLAMWLIDVGFHIGRFVIMALVISLWPY